MNSSTKIIERTSNSAFATVKADKYLTNDSFCNKRAISYYINELMRKKNLKAPDIYCRAELSKQTWSNIYSGKNCPTPLNARKLLIGLKCTLEEAEELLALCGMAFVKGNLEDECIKICLQDNVEKMVDVEMSIESKRQMKVHVA